MSASFALCRECLAQYKSLTYDATCKYTLNVIPFCSLQWKDEHPEKFNHEHRECRRAIIRLVGARTHLWRHGVIPEGARSVWTEAQLAIPDWPGFRRLELNAKEMESLDDCAGELRDVMGFVVQEFPNVSLRDEGGTTSFSACREEKSTHKT
ncbi:MAG: hypothetical protein K8T91_23640 [Planctomycetes bacterium]|nr:hypothetical protein [Planctomycetota bacterium]